MDDFEPDLTGLDQPTPLPEALRARLAAAMLDPLSGLDQPTLLPEPLRARLEATLTASRAPHNRVLALAAVVLLVAGVVSALALSGNDGSRRTFAATASTPTSTTPSASIGGGLGPAAGAATSGGLAQATAGSTGAAGAAGAGGPPFALPSPAGASSSDAVPTGTPVRVGVIRGDPAEEAGFYAYLHALDQSTARHIDAVDVSAGHPAAGTIATVNLSGAPVATAAGPPPWVTGPLLETLLAPEAVLHGSVFDFSSAAERQAHLAADALFPSTSPGATAVIYRTASGVLSSTVPDALAQVLRGRGVVTTTVVYQTGQPVNAVAAGAAFLSLDPAGARAWLQAARGVAFPKGIAGVGDLLDSTLTGLLPANAVIVSPYALPTGAEAVALGSASVGAAQLHGWVAGKSLAVALSRSGATTVAELQAALSGLVGYADGLRPPYQVRPGTNSRTPEGLLFKVQGGQLVAVGSFRTDPH